jgi:hypothetical protein
MKKILLLTLAVIAQSTYQLTAESYCKLFQLSSKSTYCLIQKILTNDERDKAFENLQSKLQGIFSTESRANLLVSSFKHMLSLFDLKFTNELAVKLLDFIEYEIVVPVKRGNNLAIYKKIADKIETLEKKNPKHGSKEEAQIEKEIAKLESEWDELAEKEAQTDKEIKKFMADMGIILSNQMQTKKVSKKQSDLLRQANLAESEKNGLLHTKMINAVQKAERKGKPLWGSKSFFG